MKTSNTKVTQQTPAGESLAAPIRLTPEQLESVVAGFAPHLQRDESGSGSTTGMNPRQTTQS